MSLTAKSEKFNQYLKELTPEKVEALIELEKQARVLVHVFDLIGQVSTREIHGLARIRKELERAYSEEHVE